MLQSNVGGNEHQIDVPAHQILHGLAYRFVKWFQCHCLADEMVDIADHQANNCNADNFRLAKRRIAALGSRLSKLKPKKYR
jgi:hypothetical protein